MSTPPDADFDLDLHFLPAWARQSPDYNRFAQHSGGEGDRGERRGDRRPWGDRPPRRDRPDRQDRPQRPEGRGGPPPGPGGGGSQFRRRDDRFRGPRRGEDRPEPRAEEPLPEVEVAFVPDEKGVDSLARQIRMTGRAYPVFEIGHMVLQKPERHNVVFSVIRKADGQVAQPLFACALDDTLWLSEDEAVRHVLERHFGTFYQAERTPIEPPKGTYTFVAQCGMSGIILGPPNYHDYQNRLHRLHAERFARVPFDVFKSRVRIVRDEAVVKKWLDEQSFRTDYVCLNLPEPSRLTSREEVEKHFREVHLPNIIRPVESQILTGVAARNLRSQGLQRLVRRVFEEQRRFPLRVVTVLSQQFAERGLQFFKVDKTVTHVSVARPHYLDLALTPVSEGVQRIVDFINAHSKCHRRALVEALAPRPPAAPAPAPSSPPPATGESTPTAPDAPPVAAPAMPATPEAPPPTPEQTAVIADLHWLIHQGHVIEFANGTLETAKKPLPRPPRPEPRKKPEAKPAESAAGGASPATVVTTAPPPSEAPAPEAEAPASAEAVAGEPAAIEPVPEALIAEAPAAVEPIDVSALSPAPPTAAEGGSDPEKPASGDGATSAA